ncbi:aspartyl/glutamyl-tRNA(Asn/Gln) amidotransferase, C subunit [Verruconis gallopava]|uniref:Aspartyl/glutamyl-tRNA(Asn/Gln) amidotransferase, C subunit n=1 Tax=Verruconis gallopava TaxID=253628 RepID=A0A0D2APN2_9PEZI|nr:aspartyl/glutamyl-tRNA(Asn/Gln) amidotransferase, C subunit [Verruconis gallopava]KIW01124.1 aspartyl/glutamyl-tRNA(Asn/Gln) amidotransferase, C subunit [Verruconis gallopava]
MPMLRTQYVSAMNGSSLAKRCSATASSLHPTKRRYLPVHTRRFQSTTAATEEVADSGSSSTQEKSPKLDIASLLAKPSWSVSSLLPPKNLSDGPPPITSEKLHHLLRLSALPLPTSAEEEKRMMDDLAAQLHFVKEMQKVDTTGVKPLRAIRDETATAEKEQEITLETLKDALAQEEIVGKHYQRIRRKPETERPQRQPSDWDPLSHAQRKAGNFFVVDTGKGSGD